MDMTTKQLTAVASAKVLALVTSGLDPIAALSQICGKENVDRMIAELYEELRKEAR